MGKKMQNLCSVHSFSWGSHSSLVVSLLSCDRRMLCKSCSGLENMIRIRLWCFDWRTDFQLQLFNGFNSCYNYNHFLNLFSLWNAVQLVLQNLDGVALYTSQFILLMSNEPFLSLSLSILSSSNHSSQSWSKDLFFRSVVALLDVFWLNLIWHSCSLSVTSDLHLVVKAW